MVLAPDKKAQAAHAEQLRKNQEAEGAGADAELTAASPAPSEPVPPPAAAVEDPPVVDTPGEEA